MHPDVEKLIEVQELDKEALELKEQLNRYPQVWEGIKKKVAGKKSTADRAERTLERHQKERRRIEQKLRLYSEDLRRNQAQQSKVKTPREYEAISKQIEQLKQRIAQLEEQGLTLLNKDEEVKEAATTAREDFAKAEEMYHSEKKRIRGQFNEKKQRVDEVTAEREKMIKGVSPEVLETYERISVRWPGSAIVPVRGGSCTGCNYQLLPGVLVGMHSNDELHYCDTCDRILSHDEDYVPEEHDEAG